MTNAAEKLQTVVSTNQNAKPPGWGNDELSKFIENAHQNHYATFVEEAGCDEQARGD